MKVNSLKKEELDIQDCDDEKEDFVDENTPIDNSDVSPTTLSRTCDDCGKTFSNRANLKRHMKLSTHGVHSRPTSKSEDTPEVLSTSLPSNGNSLLSHECTFCFNKFTSRRYLYVHNKKFRCPRRCKFCDFSGSRIISVQIHLQKEHGSSMSLEDIEKYNNQMFNEHFKGQNLNMSVDTATSDIKVESSKNGVALYACSVYKCNFSCNHLGGVTTHKRFHEARVAKEDPLSRTCGVCAFVGIPENEFDDHECIEMESETPLLPEGDESSSEDGLSDDGLDFLNEADDDDDDDDDTEAGKEDLDEDENIPNSTNGITKIRTAKPKSESSVTAGIKRKSFSKSEITIKAMYPCKVCDFVGTSPNSIAGHMNAHKPKQPRIEVPDKQPRIEVPDK